MGFPLPGSLDTYDVVFVYQNNQEEENGVKILVGKALKSYRWNRKIQATD